MIDGKRRMREQAAVKYRQLCRRLTELGRVAAAIGGPLVIRRLDPLAWPEVAANPPERCYHCKKRIYTDFLAIAAEHGITGLCRLSGAPSGRLGPD